MMLAKNFFMAAIVVMVLFFSYSFAEQPSPIELGLAKSYAILAGSTVTSSGTVGTIVTGNIGLYPGTEVYGFPPGVNYGEIYAAPNTEGLAAQGSLTTAYNQAAGLPYNVTLSSMDLGGMTLSSNVFMFAEGATMNGMLTLDANGDTDAVWVFQIASSLLIAEGSSIIFKDGIGNRDYVYWQVGSSATIGQNVPMIGNLMALESITLNDGATVHGRCLARNAAITLDNNVVTNSVASELTTDPVSSASAQPSLQPTFLSTQPTDRGVMLLPIDLGFAQPYAILAGSSVTSSGTVGTIVTGNIGLNPGSEVTGFPPAIVNGTIDIADTASFNAQGSLTTAYNKAANLPHNVTLSTMDLGGMTLRPNVYLFAGAATMNGMLTLDARGYANAVWVFQIASSLLITEGSSIIFKDGIGNPDYVYWQVGSSATIAKGVPMIGNILAFASITLNAGASVKGRCLARNAAVVLDNNRIIKPTTVSFSAKQTISGVSLEDFNADPVLSTATLKEAIAETMTGVLPSNIKKFAIAAGPTSAAFLRSATAIATSAAVHALSTADSIILTYDVVVSSTQTAEQLRAQLTAAVADGTFNTYLQMAATANGATALQTANSEAIATENIVTIVKTESTSGEETLSAGSIAGIVIGGLIVLVLSTMFIYFCIHCVCGGESPAEAHKSVEVTTVEV